MPRPQPESFPSAWSYFWARRRWKQAHGGSLIGNVAVAAIAGGITGSQVAVVVFIVVAVVVTLVRRRGAPGEVERAAAAPEPADP
jgi:hypothetical protein